MAGSHPIAELKDDPENPRIIADEALAGLGVSMEKFGDLSTVVLNRRTGFLVSGHQRVRKLREDGATEWHDDGADGGWIEHPATRERFPVRIVDWDEATARAANLAANSQEIAGTFTEAALDQIIGLRETIPEFDELRFGEMLAAVKADLGKSAGDAGAGGGGAPQLGGMEFRVIVLCSDEHDQAALIERLEKEGRKCQPLIS